MERQYQIYIVGDEEALRQIFVGNTAPRVQPGDHIILTAPITLSADLTLTCPVRMFMMPGASLDCGAFRLKAMWKHSGGALTMEPLPGPFRGASF